MGKVITLTFTFLKSLVKTWFDIWYRNLDLFILGMWNHSFWPVLFLGEGIDHVSCSSEALLALDPQQSLILTSSRFWAGDIVCQQWCFCWRLNHELCLGSSNLNSWELDTGRIWRLRHSDILDPFFHHSWRIHKIIHFSFAHVDPYPFRPKKKVPVFRWSLPRRTIQWAYEISRTVVRKYAEIPWFGWKLAWRHSYHRYVVISVIYHTYNHYDNDNNIFLVIATYIYICMQF